jgi:hypothetical protein
LDSSEGSLEECWHSRRTTPAGETLILGRAAVSPAGEERS